jgi:hypothetical protein
MTAGQAPGLGANSLFSFFQREDFLIDNRLNFGSLNGMVLH